MSGELLGFAAFLAAVVALALIFEWVIRRSPITEPEPSRLDEWDGLAGMDRPLPVRCRSTGPRGGHVYKVSGGEWMCLLCGDKRCAS